MTSSLDMVLQDRFVVTYVNAISEPQGVAGYALPPSTGRLSPPLSN
jgi:hypothetical protein